MCRQPPYEEWLSTGVSLLTDLSYEFALTESRDVIQRLTTAFEGVAAEDVRLFVGGEKFPAGLHELYPAYLMNSGRIK